MVRSGRSGVASTVGSSTAGTMSIAFTHSSVKPVYSGVCVSAGCQTPQRVQQRAELDKEKSANPSRSARLAIAATSVAASQSRGRRSERKSSSKRLEGVSTSPSTWDPIIRSAMALIVLACLISSIVFGEQVDLDHALCLFGMWFVVRRIFSCGGQKQQEGAPEFV